MVRSLSKSAENRGQVAVEFALVLPFFLGFLFVILTFFLMMILGQMTFYTTFMAARAESVNSGLYAEEAQELMPRITKINPTDVGDLVNIEIEHQMLSFLTTGSGALSNPLRNYLKLHSNVALHRWPLASSADWGDNGLEL